MKDGVRALGIAASTPSTGDSSILGGAVVRADRVTDGFGVETCTVGGMDATAGVGNLATTLVRPDVAHVLIAGVALAWYNIVDIEAVADRVDRPVLSVSFEESPGLTTAIQTETDDPDPRLDTYERLPERQSVDLDQQRLFVRAAGCSTDRAAEILQAHTPTGSGRPEPLRVARDVARAVAKWGTVAEDAEGLTSS